MATRKSTKPAPVASVERADRKIARKAKPGREKLPVRAAGLVSELADQPPLFAMCLTTLVAGAAMRDSTLARAGGRMVLSLALATGMKAIAKAAVDRTRPAVAEQRGYASRKGKRNEGPWNSFPSGHTAGAVAVARAVTREYSAAALPSAALIAVVAAAQVPKGAHYPSDVAAGAVIGLVAEAIVDRMAPWPGRGNGLQRQGLPSYSRRWFA